MEIHKESQRFTEFSLPIYYRKEHREDFPAYRQADFYTESSSPIYKRARRKIDTDISK